MTFLIISVIILNSIAFVIPKRLTKIEMFASVFFAMSLQDNVDIFLDLKYDLYGYFSKGADLRGLIPILGLYPATTVIFLNFFPIGKSTISKLIYIVGWSIFAVIFEWALIKTGTFYHNGWKYWYSAVCNPVLFLMLVWVLLFIRKLLKLQYERKNT